MSISVPNTPTATVWTLPDLGLPVSQSEYMQLWLTAMQTQYPGFTPSQADLDFIQAQVFASWASDLAQLCSAGASALFRNFGTQLLGLPYQQGASASAIVQVNVAAGSTPVATLSTGITAGGGAIAVLPVNALGVNIAPGDIVLEDPTDVFTQVWTTTGATAGMTTIPVLAQVPNFDYPIASSVLLPGNYVLPANTQLTMSLNGATIGFQTITQVNFPLGVTSLQTTVAALQPGSAANGAAGPAQLVSQIDWVTSLAVVTSASNGVDQQDDDQYMNDLASTLQLLAPRPITASDYATMALNFTPLAGTDQEQVGRATAIDGYDPTSNTYNNEREVTICVADANGNPLNFDTMYGVGGNPSSIILTSDSWGIAGWLESMREVGFIINVVSPNYVPIYVAVTVVAIPGWTATVVQQNVQTALLGYLTPLNFALPIGASSGWNNQQVVYLSHVLQVIQGALGVDHVPAGGLAIDINPNPTNTSHDLALPGPFPLPITTETVIPLSAITVITS